MYKLYGQNSEIDENIYPYLCQNGMETIRSVFEILKGNATNIRPILELLKSFLQEWNGNIIRKLKETEIVVLCDSLIDHLDNPDEEVRKLVMEILFTIRLDMALVFLEKMVNDSNLWNRIHLIELLERFCPENLSTTLAPLLNDPEEMVRERAQWVLTNYNNPSYSPMH